MKLEIGIDLLERKTQNNVLQREIQTKFHFMSDFSPNHHGQSKDKEEECGDWNWFVENTLDDHFWLILEILSNSRTHGESCGFHLF